MSVQLSKGGKVSLKKVDAGNEEVSLSKIIVGLGWTESHNSSESIDCDAFAILTSQGKVLNNNDVVFFGNLNHSSGAVRHMGDNLVGGGNGDDEQIVIDLDKIPPAFDKIIIAVNIFSAKVKNQHFGMIDRSFIHLIDDKTKTEICKYDLTENYSGFTTVLFGEVSRSDGEWKFNAIGQGSNAGSVGEFAAPYGYSIKTSTSSGGCYVATAVYGSYDCPQVWTLRRFRDFTLAESWYGRVFIHVYYAISPTLVKWFGNTKWFKSLWKNKLDSLVNKLNESGVEATPYRDINW